MNELQVFNNEEFGSVRTLLINNDPWFVGKDVADILGYQNGSRDINRHVDEEDRKKDMLFDGRQNKETIIINESGLYSLILSSKLPSAKKFKRWVTSEVLPSIRKMGIYGTEETIDRMIADPEWGIQLLTAYKAEKQKNAELETKVAVQDQQIAEMTPKVSYYDIVLQSEELMTTSAISKDYGMSAGKFNKLLESYKIQYKQSNKIWLLRAKYQDQGYTQTTTTVDGYVWTKWTQKGRLFLYDFLKSKGVLPVIEQNQKECAS